jgi:hypothetical protein
MAAGEFPDYDALLWKGVKGCLVSHLHPVAQTRIDQAADAITGQADEVAKDALDVTHSANPRGRPPLPPSDGDRSGGSSEDNGVGVGASVVPGGVIVSVLFLAGGVWFFRRRP